MPFRPGLGGGDDEPAGGRVGDGAPDDERPSVEVEVVPLESADLASPGPGGGGEAQSDAERAVGGVEQAGDVDVVGWGTFTSSTGGRSDTG